MKNLKTYLFLFLFVLLITDTNALPRFALKLGDKEIICSYFGAGHTTDNIVVYIPSERILFAGCMCKELDSKGLGNIADADLNEWPKTIQKVLDRYQDAKIVIPGHGQAGDIELLKHTLDLLNN